MSYDTKDWCKMWRKNRLFVSKMTRIWWILIRILNSLQNLQFDWSLSCKVYNLWPKKVQRSYISFMTLKRFWKWHEEFGKFSPEHSKISIICTLMGCFWSKYTMFKLRNNRGVVFDDTQNWYKFWRKTDWCLQKWHEEFGKFSPELIRKSKNCDFYWVILSKVENVWV